MLGLPYTLLTVAGLLVVIGLLQPLATRLSLSHTVLLAAVGVLIGVAAGFLLRTDLTDAFNEMAELILDFPISSTEVLYIFLPALFEAALTIDVRRMLEDAAEVLYRGDRRPGDHGRGRPGPPWPLAGMPLPGLPAAGGHHRHHRSGCGGRHLPRYQRARPRLSRLVEGSLLNDATAIVLFTMLLEC